MALSKNKQDELRAILKGRPAEWLSHVIEKLVISSPGLFEVILQEAVKTDGNQEKLTDLLLQEYWDRAMTEILSSDLYDRSDYDDFHDYNYDDDEYCDDEDQQSEYLEIAREYADEASQSIRRELLIATVELFDGEGKRYRDDLMDFAFVLCRESADFQVLISQLERLSSDNSELILNLLLKIGDDDTYETRRKSRLMQTEQYLDLIRFLNERGRTEEAIQYARLGLEQGEGSIETLANLLLDSFFATRDGNGMEYVLATSIKRNSYHALNVARRAHEYFKVNGDYEQAKQYLMKVVELSKGSHVRGLYREVSRFMSSADFAVIEPTLLEQIRNSDTEEYLEALIDRGEFHKAFEIMSKSALPQTNWYSSSDYQQAAKRLEEYLPEQVIEYYFHLMQRLIEQGAGKNRKNYVAAVRYLGHAKSVYLRVLKDEERWRRKLAEIKLMYASRRAFIEEMTK